jgi:hypothetical protein
MTIGVLFDFAPPAGETWDDAELVRRYRLVQDQLGDTLRAGQLHHSAGIADGKVRVIDVWESQQAMEADAARLVPLIQAAGVPMSPPAVWPIHNVVR